MCKYSPRKLFCSELSTFVVYVQNIPGNIYALLRIDHEGGEITANTFRTDYRCTIFIVCFKLTYKT